MLDDIPVEECRKFEEGLLSFVENAHPDLLASIREKKALDDELKAAIDGAAVEFKKRFKAQHTAA